MMILTKLIGLLIAGLGLTIFASPGFTQKLFDFFKEGNRIYIAGIFRVSVGIVLLLAASKSVVPLAAIALGLMFVVSGIIVFAVDAQKMKDFMMQYSQMPSLVIRLLGLVAGTFGILIFSIF